MNKEKPKKYCLYFDDSGSRDPDHEPTTTRKDKIDCFGLGGVLVKEEDIPQILDGHKRFCEERKIGYPLHSSRIRCGRGKFSWLRKPENAAIFLPALEEYLLSLPIVCLACVIHRPGYVARYKEPHNERLWFMCKTAFTILIERAAKFVDSQDRRMEIYFEQTGKKEDRAIKGYLRELKKSGNPFSQATSSDYSPFGAAEYQRIILGEPREKTKKVAMIQIADLVLYPMVKSAYDPEYPPYKKLREEGKLIDCHFTEEELPRLGIKYSCFDK